MQTGPLRWQRLRASLYGLLLTQRLGFDSVMLESDVVNLVNAVKHNMDDASLVFLFYNDIERLSRDFNQFYCVHVRRVGNKAIHLITRWDISFDSGFYGWIIFSKV